MVPGSDQIAIYRKGHFRLVSCALDIGLEKAGQRHMLVSMGPQTRTLYANLGRESGVIPRERKQMGRKENAYEREFNEETVPHDWSPGKKL